MIDPLRFYDLETFLLQDVRQRFHSAGSIDAFDFFAIVVWKVITQRSCLVSPPVAAKHLTSIDVHDPPAEVGPRASLIRRRCVPKRERHRVAAIR